MFQEAPNSYQEALNLEETEIWLEAFSAAFIFWRLGVIGVVGNVELPFCYAQAVGDMLYVFGLVGGVI